MDRGLEKVLKEMCRRVGAPYNSIDFKEEGWYNRYAWTYEEEVDFVQWLTDQIMRNKEVRESLFVNPTHVTENIARKAAKEFVYQFGWRYKRTEKESDEYE